MKHNLKLFVVAVLTLSLIMAFAGCKPEQKPEPTAEADKATTEIFQNNPTEKETEKKEGETTTDQSKTDNASKVLNIYSSRHYDVDKEVYDLFTKETGITVNVVEGKGPELVERLVREKDKPQADLFLTVGAESIYTLNQNGLLDDFHSEFIEKAVPEKFRGKGWSGIMYRARVIAYEKGKIDPASIKSYDDLMKEEYKGKILVRSSSSSYNAALLASFIQLNGEETAKEWAAKIVENMAREPKGNDRDQAKGVVAGQGDLAIMNSYYLVRMLNSSDPEEANVAEKIGLIFPENTHINLSYAGVIKGGENAANAVKFIEFMANEKIQSLYAEKNGEFPVNPAVGLPEIQKSWGSFSVQTIDFEKLGENAVNATKIFDEVNWK